MITFSSFNSMFFQIDVLGFKISRETDQKYKSINLVSNQCHTKTNSHLPVSAPESLALMAVTD